MLFACQFTKLKSLQKQNQCTHPGKQDGFAEGYFSRSTILVIFIRGSFFLNQFFVSFGIPISKKMAFKYYRIQMLSSSEKDAVWTKAQHNGYDWQGLNAVTLHNKQL